MARRLFTCALAALLGSAPPLAPRADDDAPPKPSFGEEVEVVGRRPRSATADPTAAATVVDASRFEGEAKTVAELVATAPGVAVHQFGGLGQAATISLRGSTADQVQIFLDGLPLNSGGGGGVDLSRIPRAWIQRIEVVRGAEGAVYGLGALGGAVNIVTRPAVAGAWSVEGSAGSFRTFEGSADGAIGGAGWGLLGAVATEGSGGRFEYVFDPTQNSPDPRLLTREHDGALALGGLVKGWASVGDGVLDAVLQASGGHRDLPGTPPNLTPSDGQRDARLGLVARFAQPVGTDFELRLSASARDDHLTVWLAPFPDARQRDVQA
ncbi:MAG: TonB-dependent receptor, partial [Anaeromyxobacteraceae bacterium]